MNGTGSTPTTPQTSSTSPHGGYDEAEHAEHLKGTYGLPSVHQGPTEEEIEAYLGWEEPEHLEGVVSEEIVGQSRWNTQYEEVIKDLRDGSFWMITWDRGSTEYQDNGPENIGFCQVWPHEVTRTEYLTKPPHAD